MAPYKINNFELQTSPTVRDLGVLLSSDLTFNTHIDAIYSIELRVISFLNQNCSESKNINCLMSFIALLSGPY